MIDFYSAIRNAVRSVRNTGPYYTAEGMAEAALVTVPAEVVAAYETKYPGHTMKGALYNRIASSVASGEW